MSAILVTGGAGYIGSHVCKALARAGHLPVSLDNLSRGHRDLVRFGPLVTADLDDRAALRHTLAEHPIAAVVHLAGYTYLGESVRQPGLYYRNNVGGALALLETLVEDAAQAPPPLVFSSTCAVYGTPERMPLDETPPPAPINPYGRGKWMIEQMMADFRAAHGLAFTALRYFNAAGADPEGETGERHDPETHLIPLAIAAALGRGPGLSVFGDDYPTPDGTAVRDYVHVSDLAAAHVQAVEALLGGAPGGVFNLGSGQGASVRQVIAAVAAATGCPVPATVTGRRPGDPPVLVADSTRARRELGWQPARSDLPTVVADAVSWHRRDWG
ncbi:UDP-glucose 4-epimerase GalE [Roseospirillum parvum]|uniref:UDP-glucose 4-epimerase n=1 Tax=Roseospirillum parvum TaxID=83401 RepID=A0A1G7TV81_9PROT|nr:UDP-glucose 4-epimerase GalE [Roseospirillum parvum]SDG39172.1 UDP-arabinose 4-epimerase [Roseospirillum parvum]